MSPMKKNDKINDITIIGAGFGGMYALIRALKRNLSVCVLEKGSGVGGTWYWNRYPGARCDVESMQYSYQFSKELEQEWDWTEKYATQPEILKYANHVAERFNLTPYIKFNENVISSHFDEEKKLWKITNQTGKIYNSKFCIMATGCLSKTNTPPIDGASSYKGKTFHTGSWPKEEISFKNQTVGIIGTGSSAIQSIPVIADQAKHLYVFQRTPHYTVPARNEPLKYGGINENDNKRPEGFDIDLTVEEIKANYDYLRNKAKRMFSAMAFKLNKKSALEVSKQERNKEYEERWKNGGVPFIGAFIDLNLNKEANKTAAEFVRNKIKYIVKDPLTAKRLTPNYTIGCKRLAVDTNYYETYNRDNVTLVDLKENPIENIFEKGIKTEQKEYTFDNLIFATGFDAMTGALMDIDIRGYNGIELRKKWEKGPKSFLGLAINGFPNLFMITGPGSPSVFTNMITSIEQHVDWIFDCLEYLKTNDFILIEASKKSEEKWVEHNQEVAEPHIRSSCSSWYMGSNIEGKPEIFLPYVGGFPEYVKKCQTISLSGYEGFLLYK